MPRVVCLVLMGLVMAGAAAAGEIPDKRARSGAVSPTRSALQGRGSAAGMGGGGSTAAQRGGRTYERQGAQAQAWYYLYRWADLFGQTGNEAVSRWTGVSSGAGPDTARVLRESILPPAAGRSGTAGFAGIRDGSRDFSDQFFTLLSPLDHPMMVLHTLAVLWRRSPADFRDYSNLAIAIAVVYDVPPPPFWPHRQVTPAGFAAGASPAG